MLESVRIYKLYKIIHCFVAHTYTAITNVVHKVKTWITFATSIANGDDIILHVTDIQQRSVVCYNIIKFLPLFFKASRLPNLRRAQFRIRIG